MSSALVWPVYTSDSDRCLFEFYEWLRNVSRSHIVLHLVTYNRLDHVRGCQKNERESDIESYMFVNGHCLMIAYTCNEECK